MLGHGAIGQFAIGQTGAGATPEFIGPDKWLVALSEPVRFKRGLSAINQQSLALFPSPIVSFGWFGSLTEPVRPKPRKQAALTPEFFFQPAPSPFVATGWFNWLSEPVRIKPGLKVHLQRVDTQDPRWIPDASTLIEGWFGWHSEPVRFKSGLSASLQQTLAYHPRILPKPNITATMSAFEINSDTALIAVNVIKSRPPATAKVSIQEVSGGNSATSVREI